MIRLMALVAVLASPAPAPAPTTNARAPQFQYLPDEENWKNLCTRSGRTGDAFDPLKCIPLASDPNRYLTLGAEVRFKYEHFFDKDWNHSNNGYLLERELIDADIHEDRLRAFVQLEHASATNTHAPVDPTWRDDLATTSAYAEYAIGGATGSPAAPISIRAGRQLLAYGSERMVDDRSGLNTEQPFDGIRARLRFGSWRTDLFAVRPVEVGPFSSDDLADRTKSFEGIYASDRIGANSLDLYGFIDQRGSQFYYRGAGPEVRDTLGVRYATNSAHFDTDTKPTNSSVRSETRGSARMRSRQISATASAAAGTTFGSVPAAGSPPGTTTRRARGSASSARRIRPVSRSESSRRTETRTRPDSRRTFRTRITKN